MAYPPASTVAAGGVASTIFPLRARKGGHDRRVRHEK